jgi:hypothetical protein
MACWRMNGYGIALWLAMSLCMSYDAYMHH